MNGHPRDFADDQFNGLQLDFQPGKGSFFIAEGTRRWNHSDDDREASGGLPGKLILGGYFDTGTSTTWTERDAPNRDLAIFI